LNEDPNDSVVIEVPSGEYAPRKPTPMERIMRVMFYVLAALVITAPYAIIGGMTKFKVGSSTSSHGGWTMSWLVVGQVAGLFRALFLSTDRFESRDWEINRIGKLATRLSESKYTRKKIRTLGMVVLVLLFATLAIGGFVTVGLTLKIIIIIVHYPRAWT
jgi:hypothetical protein